MCVCVCESVRVCVDICVSFCYVRDVFGHRSLSNTASMLVGHDTMSCD